MSPMWLTSNTPTPPRTARCSHIKLPLHGYSTGMSQPPKLTILAPRRLCSAFSAVLRRLELAGEFPESIPFAQAKIDATTHPTPRQKSIIPGCGGSFKFRPIDRLFGCANLACQLTRLLQCLFISEI